jgi:peroxiredoxin 5
VSVNDAFVMGAWAKSLDPEAKSGVRHMSSPIWRDQLANVF